MICPVCELRLRIIQTIAVGSAKVQLAECDTCLKRHTAITLIFGETIPRKHGTGIRAIAKKLRDRLDKGDPPRIDL